MRPARTLRLLAVACPLLALLHASAADARIDLIELFLKDKVLLHFDTEANRVYELQYTESAAPGSPVAWTTLFTAPNLPFPSHYVFPDTRKSPRRYYRLRVTP